MMWIIHTAPPPTANTVERRRAATPASTRTDEKKASITIVSYGNACSNRMPEKGNGFVA